MIIRVLEARKQKRSLRPQLRNHKLCFQDTWDQAGTQLEVLHAGSIRRCYAGFWVKKSHQRSYLAVNLSGYNDLLSKICPLVQQRCDYYGNKQSLGDKIWRPLHWREPMPSSVILAKNFGWGCHRPYCCSYAHFCPTASKYLSLYPQTCTNTSRQRSISFNKQWLI